MKKLNDAEVAAITVGLSMLRQTISMKLGAATFQREAIQALPYFDFTDVLAPSEIDKLIDRVEGL
jgi:hypothetical protein